MPRQPPPPLTAEARRAALATAAFARQERAGIRTALRERRLHLADVLTGEVSDSIQRMRVNVLLESVPGIGPARAEAIMADIGISPTRRLRGLGHQQRAALIARVASRG